MNSRIRNFLNFKRAFIHFITNKKETDNPVPFKN